MSDHFHDPNVKTATGIQNDAAREAPIRDRIAMLEARVDRLEDLLTPDDLTDPETQHRLILANRSQRRAGRRRG